MKRNTLLILTFLFLSAGLFAQQANTARPKPPSDAPSGYTYDFDKTMKLIQDRIVQPGEFNKDAAPLLSAHDFPKFTSGQPVTGEMREQIRKWMEANPALIINTLKHRTDLVTPF